MREAKEILEALQKRWPKEQACDWDNVGLLIGREDRPVQTVFVALDVTEETLAQAAEAGADLMVTHHPLLFSPVEKITDRDFMGRRILTLIEKQITYYAMHTNFDVTGMAKLNVQALKLEETEPLEATDPEDCSVGIGRVGVLEEALTLREFAEKVKEGMRLPAVRLYGDPERVIRRAAVCGGSGKSVVKAALDHGAQVLVTGDLDYHTAIDAAAQGLALIDPGHYGSEYVFISYMREELKRLFPDLDVKAAREVQPFQVV